MLGLLFDAPKFPNSDPAHLSTRSSGRTLKFHARQCTDNHQSDGQIPVRHGELWNEQPQPVVDSKTVSVFQHELS